LPHRTLHFLAKFCIFLGSLFALARPALLEAKAGFAEGSARIGQREDKVAAERFNESFLSLVDFSPYAAIFLLLTAGIWLIPFAEEIALTTAGYLYYAGEVQLTPILSVACAGVFLGDFFVFWVGRHRSSAWLYQSFAFLGNRQWFNVIGAGVTRYGTHALFWARFLPGVRMPAHMLVGLHNMPVATYVQASLLSIAAYVPLIFALSYSFGEEIDAALHSLKTLGDVAWGFCLLAMGVWFVVRFWASRLAIASRRRTAA